MSNPQPPSALKKSSTSSNPSLRDGPAHYSGSLSSDEDDRLLISNPPNIDLTLSITVPPLPNSDLEFDCEPVTRPHSGSFGASTLAAPRGPPILKRKSRSMSERGARAGSETDTGSHSHVSADIDAEHGAVAKSLSTVALAFHPSRSRSPSPHDEFRQTSPNNQSNSACSTHSVISSALSQSRNSPPPSSLRCSPPISLNSHGTSDNHLSPGSPTSFGISRTPHERERDLSPNASSSSRCLTRDAPTASPRDARLRPHRSVETDTFSPRPSSLSHASLGCDLLGVEGEPGSLALDGDRPTDALALEAGQTLRLSSTSTSTNASSSGTLELDTPTRVRGERERERDRDRDDSSERAASTSQRSSIAGSSLYSSTQLTYHHWIGISHIS
jgi:hypothetical protein